jgi:hypothetical protein
MFGLFPVGVKEKFVLFGVSEAAVMVLSSPPAEQSAAAMATAL